MTKQLFLNVILYITIALLLIYSAISYWNEGSRNIALLNFFVAALTLWQAIENARSIREIKTVT